MTRRTAALLALSRDTRAPRAERALAAQRIAESHVRSGLLSASEVAGWVEGALAK